MEQLWAVLLAIIPSVGVGFLFYKVIKTIIEGDRRERLAYAQWQAEHDRTHAQHSGASPAEANVGVAATRIEAGDPIDERGGPERQ